MNKKILLFSIIMVLCFSWQTIGFAQEEEIETTIETEIIEQTVLPEDLEVSEPQLLPNSPLYFLKDWWRDTKLFFTLDPVKDAELRQKIANEKLLEIRNMIEVSVEEKILERAREKYQIQQEKLEKAIEKIQNRTDEETNKFRDKFFEHQILHQKILNKLEQTVPEEILEKIEDMRIQHIDRFKETMFKIEVPERVQERLENALQNIKGSEFKDFENLDIIGKIRERVENEERNQVLQQVEGKLRQSFTEKIEALPAEAEEEIEEFFQGLKGNAQNQLKILEEIQEQTQVQNEIRERVRVGLKVIQEKVIQEKIQEQQRDQEQINKPDDTDKGSSKK